MSKNLDILGLLRKYKCFDNLKKQAADEIEHLRNEVTTWKLTAYFLGGQLSVFHPNEHPEKLVLDAYEAQGEK